MQLLTLGPCAAPCASQLLLAGPKLRALQPHVVVVSPFLRCLETAARCEIEVLWGSFAVTAYTHVHIT